LRAREAGWAIAEIDTHHDSQLADPAQVTRPRECPLQTVYIRHM
jgi:hypothetical protein